MCCWLIFRWRGTRRCNYYVLAAPRIGEDATRNRAWVDEWEGRPVLWAEQGPFGLALVALDREGNPGLLQRSVGQVGASDGWQDFHDNGSHELALREGRSRRGLVDCTIAEFGHDGTGHMHAVAKPPPRWHSQSLGAVLGRAGRHIAKAGSSGSIACAGRPNWKP